MRVYIPDKKDRVVSEVLKELYILKQAIDFQTGSPDSRMKIVDSIRTKLICLVENVIE